MLKEKEGKKQVVRWYYIDIEKALNPNVERVCSSPLAESGEAVLLGFEVVPDVVDWVQLPFDADALLDFCVLGDSIDAPVQRPVCIK